MSDRSEGDTTVRLWNFECHTQCALLEDESSLVGDSTQRVLREPGHSLDLPTKRFMEEGLLSGFGDVVVHTSDLSHCASALGALAFAVGNHLIFARNAYIRGGCRG